MKKNLYFLLVAATALFTASCSKNKTTPSNSASVMYVNGCMGTTMTAKANDKNVANAGNIAYSKNSGYQSVTAGSGVTTAFYLPDGTPLINRPVNMTVNMHYTAFVGGQITAPTFLFTSDDFTAPTAGKAKIRFVNLSPDSLNVSSSANTTIFATGITSLGISYFIEVPAGSYDLKAVDPADISTALFIATQQLNTGKIYTLMLTGSITATTPASQRKLTLIANN